LALAVAGLVVSAITLTFVLRPTMDDLPSARRERARADLQVIVSAARLFRADVGRWPIGIDELWIGRRGYLAERRPLDPWSNPYVLLPRGTTIEAISYGPDGAPGLDDLSSLDP
jgi:hypothetical protein